MPLSDAQREAIYRLGRKQHNYTQFFKYLSMLQKNMRQSSADVVENHSGLNRKNSLELMREIEATGVAKLHPAVAANQLFGWEDGVDIRDVGKSADQPLR
ncbi:MAG: hypothetical protein IPL62_03100 [Caulobacteraceae bacterium]|nr:hypothetical protein [Caulobacteraceae bacterium]